MRSKEETIIVVIAGILLFLMVVALVIIAFNAVSPEEETTSPTPTPTPINTALKSNPPVLYDEKAQKELLKRVQERKELSPSDEQAKTRILSLLPEEETTGMLYRTNSINIDYLSAPNIFQVEILTVNINPAKQEAVAWFVSQGFSQTAICNYPVQFYLNYAVAEQLRNTNITFNPLAPGCE